MINWRDVPVYRHDGEYANKNGEIKTYLASHHANVVCMDELEKAINNAYDDNRLNCRLAMEKIGKQFTMERIGYVLANTILVFDHDRRIKKENKQWAKKVGVVPDKTPWGGINNVYFACSKVHIVLNKTRGEHNGKKRRKLLAEISGKYKRLLCNTADQ